MAHNSFASIFMMICLLFFSGGCAELQNNPLMGNVFRSVLAPQGTGLNEQTVAAGLKEALRVGTERTVFSTSSLDGYLGNAMIRIALPDQFQPIAQTLRTVGLGSQVDSLEVTMNRAAEKAAGEAKVVFWDAISQMTLIDAFGILNGEPNAATTYFRGRTEDALRSRFRPIVTQKMSDVGLYQLYSQLITTYNALPLASKPAPNLEDHVTQNALDGLFSVLAEEEKNIRKNPAARTTDLLRQVFGR